MAQYSKNETKDNSVLDEEGNVFLDNEETETETETYSERRKSFADISTSKNGKAIFGYKNKVDSLILKGKEIKDTFIKEANLMETEEAQMLMNEAFQKINEIKDRKTGWLGFSERMLPATINKYVQTVASKAEQEIRNKKDIVDISNNLFSLIKNKQNEVEHSAVQFNFIKEQMIETIKELSNEARQLEEVKNNEEVSENDLFNIERILTLISNNILTFKESLININAGQNIAMQCITHIDQMLPTIENSLNDSLAINAFLNKIENLKTSFTTIANVTNQIQDSNSKSIHKAIRTSGDFEDIVSSNVKAIENRNTARRELAIEMKAQSSKEKILGIQLRNAIVDANEAMDQDSKVQVFSNSDDVGDFYTPERISLERGIENKKNTKTKKQGGEFNG